MTKWLTIVNQGKKKYVLEKELMIYEIFIQMLLILNNNIKYIVPLRKNVNVLKEKCCFNN